MAADRFERLQEVRDKAEIIEQHFEHMKKEAAMTHQTPKEETRSGKRKRGNWHGRQNQPGGSAQAGTPYLGGAIQTYTTPASTPAPAPLGPNGCYHCGQQGH